MSASARPSDPPRSRASSITRHIFWMGDVVIISFPKITSGASTDQLISLLKQELIGRFPRGFILDCLKTETYTTDVRAAGARLLMTLSNAGADVGCCVTERSSIRMIGTAVAFVSGVSVEFKRTLPEALDALTRKAG